MQTSFKLAVIGEAVSLLCGFNFPAASQTLRSCRLNDDGVRLLYQNKYNDAITMLQESIRVDDSSARVIDNLASAENNFGLSLVSHPDLALVHFRKALILSPGDPVVVANFKRIVELGKLGPNTFDGHCERGRRADSEDDYIGALVEYDAALNMRSSKVVQAKWESALRKVKQNHVYYNRFNRVEVEDTSHRCLFHNGRVTISGDKVENDRQRLLHYLDEQLRRSYSTCNRRSNETIVVDFRVTAVGQILETKSSNNDVTGQIFKHVSPIPKQFLGTACPCQFEFKFSTKVISGIQNLRGEKVNSAKLHTIP